VGSVGNFSSLHDPSVTVVADSWQPMAQLLVVEEDFLQGLFVGDWVHVEHPSSCDWIYAHASVPEKDKEF